MLVHTTGNVQLGGVHEGLFRVLYHSPGGKTAPVVPAPAQAKRNKRNKNKLMGAVVAFILQLSCWNNRGLREISVPPACLAKILCDPLI